MFVNGQRGMGNELIMLHPSSHIHSTLSIKLLKFPDGWMGVSAEVLVHFHPESHNEIENNR